MHQGVLRLSQPLFQSGHSLSTQWHRWVRGERAIFVSGREDIFSSVEINKGQVLRDQHVGKRNSPAPSSALRFLLSFPRRPPCKARFPSTRLCIVPAAQPPWKDAWNSEPTVSRIHEAGLPGVNPPIRPVAVQSGAKWRARIRENS